jgi:transposase
LLAIATVLDGAARQEAAKIGGMDRQTLRDWVIRFNEQRPDGLINKVSPGAPCTGDMPKFVAELAGAAAELP